MLNHFIMDIEILEVKIEELKHKCLRPCISLQKSIKERKTKDYQFFHAPGSSDTYPFSLTNFLICFADLAFSQLVS